MSIAAIVHKHVFGLKGDVACNITFVDEQSLVYPAGDNIILYNTETRAQRFLPVSEKCDGITAISISSNKRYAAIAERSDKPLIAIYDLHTLRRRKLLIAPPESESKEFISVAFSADGKYVIAQSAEPDWTLYYWSWEKAKLLATYRTIPSSVPTAATNAQENQPQLSRDVFHGSVVNQVSFNPNDSTQICVAGAGSLKLLRYSEGTLKPIVTQKPDIKNYLCHCWTNDEHVIAGTDEGIFVLLEVSGEIRAEFAHTHANSNQRESIRSMHPFAKGFIAGASHGALSIYERVEDALNVAPIPGIQPKEPFKKVKGYSTQDETSAITNITINTGEDILVCTSENSQIFSISLTNAEAKADDSHIELLAEPFHEGQILGMDTCIRKPLIVTCSADRTVRVWNYMDSKSELVKYFPEETFSVSIHPSGLYILVGFSDKLRLMNLLIDDIRPYREFSIRGCRECKFSTGGQYFAAVHGNNIQIYSTWNFESLGILKGHNGKVKSLYWTQDDTKLVSAGMDGAIYDWSLKDLIVNPNNLKREGESILKSCSYTCAVSDPTGKTIYAVGSDKTIKEISDSQITREVESDVVITQIALSHQGKMMFTGTAKGSLRAMKFPFAVGEAVEFQEHHVHSAPITRIRVSYDDQYLFTTSEDGCLYVFKLTEKENVKAPKREHDLVFADEILVTKSDLEEKTSAMAELKTRVEELKMENEYQLRLKDMTFNEKVKEMTEKFSQEIESLKITGAVLRTDREKEQARHEEELAEERERFAKELLDLETTHNSRLMAEYEKYQQLQFKSNDLQGQWERQMQDMKRSKDSALTELTMHFETKLKDKQSEFEKLQAEMKQQARDFEETMKESEEDADTEILELKQKYERKLKEEKDIVMRLKGENGIMRKRFNTLQSEIDAHKTEISKMAQEEKKLQTTIKSLEKDIASLRKEIQERDETIQDKEKRIYDLKKKNQELEKFKFVLDYKIKELKRQIEPREQDIQDMTHQIKDMDVELESYHKSNSNLDLAIEDLKLKLKSSEKEVAAERSRVNNTICQVRKFKVELHDCVQYIQEPKLLKNNIKKLYQKYCLTADDLAQDHAQIDNETQYEYARQREYLERTVSSLRKKVSREASVHRSENVKVMNENITLIKEINQLRKDTDVSKKSLTSPVAQPMDTNLVTNIAHEASVKLPPL